MEVMEFIRISQKTLPMIVEVSVYKPVFVMVMIDARYFVKKSMGVIWRTLAQKVKRMAIKA